MNQAFQDLRVRTMKSLQIRGFKKEAQKLKVNWRFLTKNRQNINHSEYKSWRSFRSPKYPLLTEAMMIDRLLIPLEKLMRHSMTWQMHLEIRTILYFLTCSNIFQKV